MSDFNMWLSNKASKDPALAGQIVRLTNVLRDGLSVVFQPVYCVGSDIPFAVEGFIRGPVGSALESPDRLFEAARKVRLTDALDELAFLTVIDSFAALHWTGKLFLNVRPSTFLTSGWSISHLQRAIERGNLLPSQIIIEFTEHAEILSSAVLLKSIEPLLDQGITISLDDVGAGFANMRVICELQPQLIKVDRYFISGIAESTVKRSVVQNFASLASDIGARVVAECVEGNEDGQVAAQLGIDLMQGHLFGRPTRTPDLAALPQGFWTTFYQSNPPLSERKDSSTSEELLKKLNSVDRQPLVFLPSA
jgi:EAL domain-containing protein (putative c-di-GMP-specific phosphodiesterase class I)